MTEITVFDKESRRGVLQFIEALNLDRPWIITVKRKTKKRSLSANGLYWKWMEEAGKELGYDKADLHEVMKIEADCPVIEINMNGKNYRLRTTTRLTDKDFADYMDRCYRKLVGDMGLYLTLPEERQSA